MRLPIILSIYCLIFILNSCSSSEKKSEQDKQDSTSKKDLNDPQLQNMLNSLDEESVEKLEDGFHELKYENGNLKTSGTIANGKKEGLWTYYQENGVKWSECNFTNGLADGKVVSYHPNGQINYIGYFTNGVKSGEWMFYDAEGKLIKEVTMNK